MAYAGNLTTLSWGGSLAGGNEIWSCGIHISAAHVDAPGTWGGWALEMLPLLGANLQAYHSNPDVKVPWDAKLEWAKLAYIGTDGKYLQEAKEQPFFANGSVNAPYLPQASMVNGLLSTKWKDPGKNNRFYMPFSHPATTDNNYKLEPANQTLYANALAGFIDALNTSLATSAYQPAEKIIVASSSGTGHAEPVHSVRVGAIIDTQRRRRNALEEDYVEVVI